ncbi:sensor histidine kinase [Nonomuraea dietziae]|uniref:sensor histidine kinase n=1 Tax=Nonomuraea dietziae TaxID=65515 RepID=UPI0033D7CB21
MISAVVQPFRLALFRGEADPAPPRSRRLRPPMPGLLRGLLPFGHLDLVQVADLLLAWALFGTVLSDLTNLTEAAPQPMWLLCLTATGLSLPVALRDRWPLAAWRLALALLPSALWMSHLLDGVRSFMTQGAIMCLLVLYSVAVRCDRRITPAVWAISLVAAWFVLGESAVPGGIALSVVVLFGYNVRVRRSATLSRDTAVEERSVLAERARIARELHDVVAHHLSVIAIQAEAVPLEAGGDPARLDAGLAQIRGLSLEAIKELRQVLGVLRDEDGRTDTAPAPGLDRMDELVANARTAGLAVLVKRSGELDGLPKAVEVSAYRIVQESLSNAMRHAPGSTVAVELVRDDGLRIRVANGPASRPGGPRGAGHGLLGMRERASLLGGSLETGPMEGGGFEVKAVLPLEGAS